MSKTLANLPLAKSLPQYNLTPDSATPSVKSLLGLSNYTPVTDGPIAGRPSALRRSGRQIQAHYSFVTPLPVEFPYSVPQVLVEELKAKAADKEDAKLEISLEDILARYEPSTEYNVAQKDHLSVYTSPLREAAISSAELFGISMNCAQDILPDLDVGEEGSEARKELVEILSGRSVMAKLSDDSKEAFAPWSLVYGGHQFGSWASQLGDGRAISILTTPSKTSQTPFFTPQKAELQLKGAGRTPFSRFADGLAVLRSSVREYLGSEAMAALGIPTSRALSLIHLPELEVAREKVETGAIVCRVAPSWLRIGSFEIHKSREDWELLRELTAYVSKELFGLEESDKMAQNVVKGVAQRNAKMIAGWQAVGFMHGVMNTDNFSLLGLTIDYGPYAFMDIYDPMHICNHSDDMGRYAYKFQPTMGDFAIRKLGEALHEMIGTELETGKAVTEGWAKDLSREELRQRKEKGMLFMNEVSIQFKDDFRQEYNRLMGQKLGFLTSHADDQRLYVDTLLDLMADLQLDFTNTFRFLCQFPGTSSPSYEDFVKRLVPWSKVPKAYQSEAHQRTKDWLASYEKRLESEDGKTGVEERRMRMQAVNPRFVLRQWVLEEAISRLDEKKDTAFLQLVLDMSTSPYESYGEHILGEEKSSEKTGENEEEQVRLCGSGPVGMLGFQCSCSS